LLGEGGRASKWGRAERAEGGLPLLWRTDARCGDAKEGRRSQLLEVGHPQWAAGQKAAPPTSQSAASMLPCAHRCSPMSRLHAWTGHRCSPMSRLHAWTGHRCSPMSTLHAWTGHRRRAALCWPKAILCHPLCMHSHTLPSAPCTPPATHQEGGGAAHSHQRVHVGVVGRERAEALKDQPASARVCKEGRLWEEGCVPMLSDGWGVRQGSMGRAGKKLR